MADNAPLNEDLSMLLLICALVIGMLLGGPISKWGRSVVQAIHHFLVIGFLLVLAWLLIANMAPLN